MGIESRYVEISDYVDVSRSFSAGYIILFSFVQGLYFYYSRNANINSNYIGVLLFISLISIILSATRGWIIATMVLFIGAILLCGNTKQMIRNFRLVLISIAVGFIIFSQVPIVHKQVEVVYNRMLTLDALVKGDITAAGTLQRINVRGPKVIQKFWESPVFGWGFSDEYYAYQDGHVGNQNILLSVGIVGYLFLIALFIHFCRKIYILSKFDEVKLHEGKGPLIYIISLIAIFIIHSTSTQFWGYIMEFGQLPKVIFFGFFFASVNAVFIKYLRESNEN
jgi:hypothetical protein